VAFVAQAFGAQVSFPTQSSASQPPTIPISTESQKPIEVQVLKQEIQEMRQDILTRLDKVEQTQAQSNTRFDKIEGIIQQLAQTQTQLSQVIAQLAQSKLQIILTQIMAQITLPILPPLLILPQYLMLPL